LEPSTKDLRVAGLNSPARVLYDARGIPHIFASDDQDLFFSQGFVTARDRLWQMDFQSRAAEGRLAEILGPDLIDFDRFQRSIGMPMAARTFLDEIERDSEIYDLVKAYSRGVNAYIESLQPKDYPTEFELIGYQPELWTPLKTACLFKHAAWANTGVGYALQVSQILSSVGESLMRSIIPEKPVFPEPTVKSISWPFPPFKLKKPERLFIPPNLRYLASEPGAAPLGGSNSWVVSGEKSFNGHALLACDPHTELQLPSIWYELQLVSQTVNAYGASLPGIPNIIVGFNKQIAWGITATGVDVSDWYHITFKDKSKDEYLYDGQWEKSRKAVETIAVKGDFVVKHEVIYTRHGPVVREDGTPAPDPFVPEQAALRWLGHDASNEIRGFYALNRARNHDEFVSSLTYFACPPLGFIFASRDGDIAFRQQGKFPARWPYQGRVIADGSDPLYLWQDWIPFEQNPHIRNPADNYLSSANQYPVDESYPHYIAGTFPSHFRIKRINQLLEQKDRFSPADFLQMQADVFDLRAATLLPRLIELLNQEALSQEEREVLSFLSEWDYKVDKAAIAPTAFAAWLNSINFSIWGDKVPLCFQAERPGLIDDLAAHFILQASEPSLIENMLIHRKQTLIEVNQRSFQEICNSLKEKLGPLGEEWEWGRVWGLRIPHLSGIEELGAGPLKIGGNGVTINDVSAKHSFGPSWRLIVSFTDQGVKAWTSLPGGQSGDPRSEHYIDQLQKWAQAEMSESLYLDSPDAEDDRIVLKLDLEPAPP